MQLLPWSRSVCLLLLAMAAWTAAQSPPPSRADILRGAYGPYRANNDLLSYDLDIRVDPEKKFISGKNTIRFKMLKDDQRIQLDLFANLQVDKIRLGSTELKYVRELNTVFVDFPAPLKKNSVQSIEFYYSGSPQETGRFGGISFRQDPFGRPWITTACEEIGASVWWPNKDQQRDEVENMHLRVAVPRSLTDISNGRLIGKTDLGDGYTRYDWAVHYPVNSYCVSLNIGHYEHFSDKLGELTLDYYCLPENLEKARRQFAQARPMLEAFQKYFGEYPFMRDGYKLIEVPYSGMEHQSAVTYGNRFANGYLERDWTGVGVSLKFDFIIVHESAHEWFGNSITAGDVSDQWIHEGWATYAEVVYVEALFGREDARAYVNGYQAKVKNQRPIVTAREANRTPSQDQYFKGALFLNTLRSVIDHDARWWKLLRDYCRQFKYRNILTEDVVMFFNRETGLNLTPIFDQYLRQAALPALELRFQESDGRVDYRWTADVKDFSMPVKVGRRQFDHGTLDGYQFFLEMGPLSNANRKYLKGESSIWNEWMEHGNYDQYWKAQNVPQPLTKVRPAVMTVGGWFDAEDLPGPLKIYDAIEKHNPQTYNTLVMGPWCHGCWSRRDGSSPGEVSFGSNTSTYYQEQIELPFFNFFLKDKGANKLPEAYVFETGTNQWKQYEQWPPKGAQPASLFRHANGKLSFQPPGKEDKNGYDEYISDPAKPVPFINRLNIGLDYSYMTDDQRFAATRPDVLVYRSDELTENVLLAGPLFAELFVSTSGTDSDFVVKLIDLFPDGKDKMGGYQMLVRGEPIRAKYRHSFEKPEPMKPNQPTRIPLYLPDVNHTFQKGHRIMIQIQSTWFPLMDRNPQKFCNIYQATEADFQKATQRVYRTDKLNSHVKVTVLK